LNVPEQLAEPRIEYEPSQVFVVASDKILAKEFDGELTLINLDTGVYFAAGGATLDIWQALTSGRALGETAQDLARRFKIAESDASGHVTRIVGMLVGYGLLVASATAASSTSGGEPRIDSAVWSDPWLESYGDMQDLLLLDPVHDVQGGSWPKAS
jgi:hypothetical protein